MTPFRLGTLIEEESSKFPYHNVIVHGLELLEPIKTTGNLRAGFALILQSLLDVTSSTDQSIRITVNKIKENQIQEIIFIFNSDVITPDLMESYSRKQKSDIVASSSARVNLLVAAAIIHKNRGNVEVKRSDVEPFKSEIIVELPIYSQA